LTASSAVRRQGTIAAPNAHRDVEREGDSWSSRSALTGTTSD